MAKLIVKLGPRTLKEMVLPKGTEFTIGRSPDNTLQLDNLAVSRFHALISHEGSPFYLMDLGSKNGTRLNSKRISQKASLKKGDKIGIGKFVIEYLDDISDNGERKPNDDGITTLGV